MIVSFSIFLTSVVLLHASPLERRVITSLNQAAFEEAQRKDDTAIRAFLDSEIKTSDGKCLFINELSGDFRANLTPIQVATCDDSAGQKWDVITQGKHNDQSGSILLVNTLTQACANFDPRRATGNTVIMFSCGGRADGSGGVTKSQLFRFAGGAGPLAFEPENAAGTCLAVTANNVLDQAPCEGGNAAQSFTFGGTATSTLGGALASKSVTSLTHGLTPAMESATATPAPAASSKRITRVASQCGPQAIATATDADSSVSSETVGASAASSLGVISNIINTNPTTPFPVSRAGGILQPSAAAESNQRDDTAIRAFSSVSLKSADGQCLVIDPTAGDFRQNLIPVAVQPCIGSANEKFDLITQGKHNNAVNATLVVSSLTQGCLNFDARRAAGDQALLFSCGGRADGEGGTTNSQLFGFGGGDMVTLAPQNGDGSVCLVPKGAKLEQTTCSGAADSYSIV
ncbi:hypothetical protein B2J93_5047 [Marssonina coronariae]|uniref:Ricin B lectin domain-containing protein n=1 Tax=Diplocarpon coronariae TaxID=2795749 RepID=A0A218Z6E9_9HELO|nr:hypothetical protein B2J93_5047 [Marssonina coronariae]